VLIYIANTKQFGRLTISCSHSGTFLKFVLLMGHKTCRSRLHWKWKHKASTKCGKYRKIPHFVTSPKQDNISKL